MTADLVIGLAALIMPEGDYVWRDGRYEYVRRPLPKTEGLAASAWWRQGER